MNGAILIVARNNLALTKKAVRSALAQDIPCDVMVLDNASTDGTGIWLTTRPVAACVYPTQKSLAYCWNHGIHLFHTVGYHEVLVCNNDIELRSDTYRLLASSSQPFISGVGVDSPDQVGHPGDRTVESLLATARNTPTFSCFMITKTAYDYVGKFDENYYPAYCEDCDYHVRMHRAGIRAICVDLPFYHMGSQTMANATLGEAARIHRGADDSRHRFRIKYGCIPGSPEYEKLFV